MKWWSRLRCRLGSHAYRPAFRWIDEEEGVVMLGFECDECDVFVARELCRPGKEKK